VPATDAARYANAHQDGQAPAKGDVGVAAVDDFARRSLAEQDHHCDDAITQGDQDECTQELGQQLPCEGRLAGCHPFPFGASLPDRNL
jgi:hypothetical protein